MRILLTNDDGIDAPGIHALARVLGREHEIHLIAPDRERSGVGHAFTLQKPLRCDPATREVDGLSLAGAWRCSGTPVDCVKLGLLNILDERPDWVVSGINRGANLTVDTLYSGTVAAALEGHLMGMPSLAVSLAVGHGQKAPEGAYETAARWAARVIAGEGRHGVAPGECCFNLNVPALPAEEIRGLRSTTIGRCRYDDGYRVDRDPTGRPYYWLQGTPVIEDDRDWSDVVAIRDGWASLTPLWHDLTSVLHLDKMRASEGDAR